MGNTVTAVGRKGKYFWLALAEGPWLFGHLGMSGWIRELGKPTVRLLEHGNAPLDDDSGRPRFLKMLLQAEDGARIAFTDGRRLGRLWLSASRGDDPKLGELGPDMLLEPWSVDRLSAILAKRNAPMKALLLDQKLFAGVGNWVADEVLYHAGIAPKRLGSSLTKSEIEAMLEKLDWILRSAVDVGADSDQFPDDWLFKHRWGGSKGADTILGRQIVREPVGGRTTAWVPEVQK
jgi:formamidopyrimidine-DNA glycosylase